MFRASNARQEPRRCSACADKRETGRDMRDDEAARVWVFAGAHIAGKSRFLRQGGRRRSAQARRQTSDRTRRQSALAGGRGAEKCHVSRGSDRGGGGARDHTLVAMSMCSPRSRRALPIVRAPDETQLEPAAARRPCCCARLICNLRCARCTRAARAREREREEERGERKRSTPTYSTVKLLMMYS